MHLQNLRATLLAALALGATGCVDGKDEGDDSEPADDSAEPEACVGATSLLDAFGNASGFEQCDDGTIHRVEVLPTSAENGAARCAGTEDSLACTTDSECNAAANGACLTGVMVDGPDTWCGCVYSCASDADCDAGQFCAPAGLGSPEVSWSTCAPADCLVDSECPSGECGLSVWNDGCSYNVALGCRSDADACRLDSECLPEQTCDLTSEGWACLSMDCTIGRPLICEGEARTAPVARVHGWSGSPSFALPESPARRRDLARRWTRIAAMEHASIASFARFTLELLGLGAPAELLALAQQAAADEVRHAQLAYGLAGAFAGEPVGPGPLSLAGVGPASDLRAFVRALVAEACVGESVGAAEALAASEGVEDPALRAALRGVADDEARHAALAWRTLGWALRGGDAALRHEVRAVAEEALAAVVVVHEQAHEPAYGLPGGAETRAIRERAARQVVRPLLERALAASLA